MQNRGEVYQILDHRMMNTVLNGGREISVMHIQIEWQNASEEGGYGGETEQIKETSERFTWEPLTRINRDVPQLVTEYFKSVRLDLADILEDEAKRRGNHFYTRNKIFGNQGSKNTKATAS